METVDKNTKVVIDDNRCEIFRKKGIVDIIIGILFLIGLIFYYTVVKPYYRPIDYGIMLTVIVPFFLGYENLTKKKDAQKYSAAIDLGKYSVDEILDGSEKEVKEAERAKKRGEVRKNIIELIDDGVFVNIYYDFERDCVDFL